MIHLKWNTRVLFSIRENLNNLEDIIEAFSNHKFVTFVTSVFLHRSKRFRTIKITEIINNDVLNSNKNF